jgi:hypothetical protein
VRIGLLGAIDGQEGYVKGLGSFCLDSLRAERIVYLGGDGALDQVIGNWATQLVGEHPEEAAIWLRTLRCVDADSQKIDLFIAAERARQSLKRFQSLPEDGGEHCLEVFREARLLLCHDSTGLSSEDLDRANVVAYGNDRSPRVVQRDGCYFICPGSLEEAGLMVLDDDDDGALRVRLFDRTARLLAEHSLPSTAKFPPPSVEGT